ncbi:MAG: hypothetical protein H5U28_10755 [Burkholderiaceae bacterium]|nr:hypothetical protein [Burkholderiaceae bacterium]
MQHHQDLPDVLDELLNQVRDLHAAQTVQRAAFVVLARHLSKTGHADLLQLARDLEMMADSQPEPAWQSGLAELAEALLLVHAGPSADR